MMIFGLLFAVLLLLLAALYALTGRRYTGFQAIHGRHFKLTALHSPMLYLIDRLSLLERYPSFTARLQKNMAILYRMNPQGRAGGLHSIDCARAAMAEVLAAGYSGLLLAFILPFTNGGDLAVFYVGIFIAASIPFAICRDWETRVKRRRQDILLELPELLDKVALLVNAGETVQQALAHCSEQQQGRAAHPLYTELRITMNELANGMSFSQALEQFSRRCGVHEVSILTTTILLNYRRGGEYFVLALRDLSRSLWEKRKAVSRMRGEEASSKLVFPMILIFLVVLILVATPAVLLLQF